TVLGLWKDNLVVIGSGDPSVGDPVLARMAKESITAAFVQWAKRLKAAGVTTIQGELLVDDFIFDQEYVHPSWRQQQKNLQKWYTAPVGGLNFNDNCIDVVIKPAKVLSQPAIVSLIPDIPWVQLDNSSKTTTKGEPIVVRRGTGPIQISVSGPVSKPNTAQNPLSVTVTDPGLFFANTCRHVLKQEGITINGAIRRQRVQMPGGILPRDFKVIATYERRLDDVIRRMNKRSQNMFAEAALKTLGAYVVRDNLPGVGSFAGGRAAVLEFLKSISVLSEGVVIDDGSGLSHSNRVTPKMITTILGYMDRHSRRSIWWSSLAEAGDQEGSMRRRLKDLKGKVFAKTGHINGVSALSGYVLGPADRRYAFSVICNQTYKVKGGISTADRLQDKICRVLATWEPVLSSSGG
ncbi:MAG: D-alanyl-D-alanine carboxypeptidase/D-alanyl-D-alanine-endopeptidase, partial [Planctomycetota bacterium]